MTPEAMTPQTWASHLNSGFALATEQTGPQMLNLKSVVPYRHGSSPGRNAYSLIFSGSADVVLPQRTYRFHHPELGELDILESLKDRTKGARIGLNS